MTATLAVYGRLGQEPRVIETRKGTPMAVASIAVDVEQEGAPLWLGVVAFGGKADDLLKHGKGECISAVGRLNRRTWTDRNGEDREQLQVVADAIVSARTVRPGGKKDTRRQEEQADDPQAPPDEGDDLPDDEIPF